VAHVSRDDHCPLLLLFSFMFTIQGVQKIGWSVYELGKCVLTSQHFTRCIIHSPVHPKTNKVPSRKTKVQTDAMVTSKIRIFPADVARIWLVTIKQPFYIALHRFYFNHKHIRHISLICSRWRDVIILFMNCVITEIINQYASWLIMITLLVIICKFPTVTTYTVSSPRSCKVYGLERRAYINMATEQSYITQLVLSTMHIIPNKRHENFKLLNLRPAVYIVMQKAVVISSCV